MGETIITGNVLDEYKRDMQIYAIAVNRKQSVPEVKDGLKTVARRILTSMFDHKLTYNSAYIKAARVVGDTMGKYHPHGDMAIYGALVNMANWYSSKIPLIDGHGNYGNMIGTGPAAHRYTECRLSEFGQEAVLGDLFSSKDIVDWVSNYDGTRKEPEYLPAKVPLLLVNGTMGIGVGMKTEIPTHNLGEVIDATIALIDNPNAKIVLIPDHYMGCDIIDTNWKAISNTGQGKYRVRAHIDIGYEKDIPYLYITGVPNSVTLFRAKSNKENEGVVAKIESLMKEGKIPQIQDVYSDTKGNDLKYVVKLQKGADPNFVKSFLYKNTLLENSYRVNFEVLDGIDIRRFSYKAYLEYFIDFALTLKFRSYASMHQKLKTDWRQLQLYIMVMESGEIENIQRDIRNLKDVSAEGKAKFREKIIKRFKVSDIEADFIMKMDQTKAAIGYLPIYKEKCKEYENAFKDIFMKLNEENILKQELKEELLYFKNKYGEPRKCRIIKDKEDSIPGGEFTIVVTENNFIKKISTTDPINTYRGDAPKFSLLVDNRESILLFDRHGRVFKLPVHKVDICDKNSPGFDVRLLIKNCTSDIMTVMYEPTVRDLANKVHKNFLTVITAGHYIKKMDLDDFLNVPPSGIIYTKLNDGDCVKDITIIPNNIDVILYSDRKALRFNSKDIPHYKRSAAGVAAMNNKGELDGISVIYPNAEYIVVITKQGKVNKFNISGLASSGRNRAGSSVIKLGKTDSIVSIFGVSDSSTISAVTKSGVVNVPVSDIPTQSSVSVGTKMFPEVLKTRIF